MSEYVKPCQYHPEGTTGVVVRPIHYAGCRAEVIGRTRAPRVGADAQVRVRISKSYCNGRLRVHRGTEVLIYSTHFIAEDP